MWPLFGLAIVCFGIFPLVMLGTASKTGDDKEETPHDSALGAIFFKLVELIVWAVSGLFNILVQHILGSAFSLLSPLLSLVLTSQLLLFDDLAHVWPAADFMVRVLIYATPKTPVPARFWRRAASRPAGDDQPVALGPAPKPDPDPPHSAPCTTPPTHGVT